MPVVLITGATGFIGKALCTKMLGVGWKVKGAFREESGLDNLSRGVEWLKLGPVEDCDFKEEVFAGVDIVVHLAARVHIMGEDAAKSFDEFRKVNVVGTQRLAQAAVKAGVRRFVFISSVKVNGEGDGTLDRDFRLAARVARGTPSDISSSVATPFGSRNDKGLLERRIATAPAVPRNDGGAYTEEDVPAPEDAYGASKREAEDVLVDIAKETGLEVVILRLPLVYGPGVKANFRNLIKLAGSGLPLPFKGINNRRSFVYLGNVVDAIVTCAEHPKAVGETFMVSDGQDVSTPELIRMIGREMRGRRGMGLYGRRIGRSRSSRHFLRHFVFGRHAGGAPCDDGGLFFVPAGLLRVLCKMIGKGEELEKLIGNLTVDSSKIRDLLGWRPPFTLEEGIRETVRS
jgi:nucleoside-diphosphate-sugar epimerase